MLFCSFSSSIETLTTQLEWLQLILESFCRHETSEHLAWNLIFQNEVLDCGCHWGGLESVFFLFTCDRHILGRSGFENSSLAISHCLGYCRGNLPATDELLSRDEVITLKRCMYANQCHSLPPVVTHNVTNDSVDPSENGLECFGVYFCLLVRHHAAIVY